MSETTMSIQEISETAGCNEKTVRRIGKSLFPGLFRKGVKVQFDNLQAIQLMKALPKKNIVGQMSQEPRTNVRSNIHQRIDRIELALEKLTLVIPKLIEQKPVQKSLPQVKRISKSAFISQGKDLGLKYKILAKISPYHSMEKEFLELKAIPKDSETGYHAPMSEIIYAFGLESEYLAYLNNKIETLGKI